MQKTVMISFRANRLRNLLVPGSVAWLMADIAEAKGKQDLYTNQAPQLLKTLRDAALIQSAESSNRIEGITVAPERLAPLVMTDIRPQNRSEEEVQNYRKALQWAHANAAGLIPTAEVLLQLHRIIQEGAGDAGKWKARDNDILEYPVDGSAPFVRFKPTPAAETPQAVSELCQSYRAGHDERWAHPLILSAAFVFDFLCIHPFRDGNGRLARLLTLLTLYQHDYEVGRYISLERVIEESKTDYYESLRASSQGWHEGRHDLTPWLVFWLTTIRRAYTEFGKRVGDLTEAPGSKRAMVHAAIDARIGDWSVRDIQHACPGVSLPTIRRVLADLLKARYIETVSRGRGAKWRKR